DRGFHVTGTLTIGSDAAPIALTNGSVFKDGTGDLILTGSQTFSSLNINDGAVRLGVATAPSPAPEFALSESEPLFDDGAPAQDSVQAVPEPGTLGLLSFGLLGCLCRRRGIGVERCNRTKGPLKGRGFVNDSSDAV